MRFAERMNLIDIDFLQLDEINPKLRNRILNLLFEYIDELGYVRAEILKILVDYCGLETGYEGSNKSDLKSVIRNTRNDYEWYLPYEIIEKFIEILNVLIDKEYYNSNYNDEYINIKNSFLIKLSSVLKEEKSGYRLLNEKFVPIANEMELESIAESMKTPYDSVNKHMRKSIEAFSNKQNPDYEGTIKNAMSAVESMCSIIVGKDTTLSNALKKLKENGVELHGAFEEALVKLYGYTSDEKGIRHGGIDFKNAPQEDAKFMLITCSAFVNYLVEKYNENEE